MSQLEQEVERLRAEVERLKALVPHPPSAAPLKARKLTAQQQLRMLTQFCEAHGAEQIEQSYGWEGGAPRTLAKNERSWTFHVGADIVGWGSVILNTQDGSDDEATLLVGVFPDQQKKGYRTQILDWLCAESARLGADWATMIVRKSNEVHYNRTMREAHDEGNPWTYAGDVWAPAPGYGYFIRGLTEL